MGATYEELEWAMREIENPSEEPTERQRQVMERYIELNRLIRIRWSLFQCSEK